MRFRGVPLNATLSAVALLLGCGSAQTTSPTPPPALAERERERPPAFEFDLRLGEARAARNRAEAIEAPKPPGSLDQQSSLESARTEIHAWFKKRRAANDAADAAYERAFEVAGPSEQVTVLLERGELWLRFVDAFVAAGKSVVPEATRANAEQMLLVDRALRRTVRGQYARAREHLTRCLMVTSARGIKGESAARCEKLLRESGVAAPESKKLPDDWRYARIDTADRPHQPTRQVEPCAFSGSIGEMRAWLYASPRGGEAVMYLESAEFARLELPAVHGGRASVLVEWPVKAQVWLAETERPLELTRRLELVKGHIWLSSGARVAAWGPTGSHATVAQPPAGGEEKVSSPTLSQRVACRNLALAHSSPLRELPVQGEPGQVSGVVPLHARPDGSRIGELVTSMPTNVNVLARQSGWARIAGYEYGAYDFDAWTPERFIPPGTPGFGLATMGLMRTPPDRFSRAEVPLRLEPEADSAVVATLAADVPLLTGRREGAFVAIKVPGVTGNNPGRDFWISETNLDAASRPAQ